MKIRIDFVTNSSSASFVLTARDDVLEIKIDNFTKLGKPGGAVIEVYQRSAEKRG